MKVWKSFPEGAWSPIGGSISGFGSGEGPYGAGYAIDTGTKAMLNGRITAQIRLAGDRPIQGAGVIARAYELHSYIACYVVSDTTAANHFNLRLAAFKEGRLVAQAGLKQSFPIPNNLFTIALQFFSGDMVGEVATESGGYKLEYLLPELSFPGYCGLIRFYGTSAVARNLHIEELTMKPKLPEEKEENRKRTYPFSVFLSHSSADKPTVLKVLDAFDKEKITYWVDHQQIKFGDGIVSKIEKGLQDSRYVVVCLSENIPRSGWCRAEYGPILYREFSGDTSRRVIPLSLDGSKNQESIPLLLSDKLRADFTDSANFAAFLEFLRETDTNVNQHLK